MDTQVVVADDDGQIRNLIAECLIDRGFKVKQAVDGLKALQILKEMRGVVLLVTDLRMPRMGGQELVEAALAVHPELKVIFVTGYPGELLTGEALKAREIRAFPKPFSISDLCDHAVAMLGRP